MTDPSSMLAEGLHACLRERYAVAVVASERLALGLDSLARVYRVTDEAGTNYLVKARARTLYRASLLAPRYLVDQGVAVVVAPLPALDGALWTRLAPPADAWTISLSPFIVGASGWSPRMTEDQWRLTGAILRRIHSVAPPAEGAEGIVSLRRETFDVSDYARAVEKFDARLAGTSADASTGTSAGGAEEGDTPASAAEVALRAHWRERRSLIHALVAAMQTLAERLRRSAGPYVICHGDLHPGNLLRDNAGGVWVVDWDDVLLAPRERDFLFVGEPDTGGPGQAGAPFFQGYQDGHQPAEIDWVAVTYYRCERVVQDVLECAEEACSREGLEPEFKANAAELFGELFAPDNNMDAARRAAARLPAELSYLAERLGDYLTP